MVRDTINDLGINHQLIVCDQVGDVFANGYAFVEDLEAGLLFERNPLLSKLHNQSVFIRLFQ